MLTGRIKQIEEKTEDILQDTYGDLDQVALPVDLSGILEKYNITLKAGEFENEDIVGAYDREKKTIYVSKHNPYPRQSFTIAHELGHYFLHKDKAKDVFYRFEFISPEQSKNEEQDANWFAASLLMPRVLVLIYWNFFKNVEKIAEVFGVSNSAARWRLTNLGVL